MGKPQLEVNPNSLYEIEVRVVRESEKAYLLEDIAFAEKAGYEEAEAWFPKSHVNLPRRNIKTKLAIAAIPGWLLIEKSWRI